MQARIRSFSNDETHRKVKSPFAERAKEYFLENDITKNRFSAILKEEKILRNASKKKAQI